MKLKDLKNLMEEDDLADESKKKKPDKKDSKKSDAPPPEPTTEPKVVEPTQPKEKKSTPKEPKKNSELKRDTADGVGRESYKISTTIATKLESTITNEMNVSEVSVANNIVTIVFDFSETENKEIFFFKKTRQKITQDKMIDHINTIIVAVLNTDVKKVSLTANYVGGILTITAISNIEKDSDI